jgi:hypothetical protein
VHPSWRDLVVEHLAADPAARRAFLRTCELHGAALALSVAGGAHGERRLPLLRDDADWDALGDTVHRLCRELGQDDVARLLGALEPAVAAEPSNGELQALAELALTTSRRRFDHEEAMLSAGVAEAWLRLASLLERSIEAPALVPTWQALAPRPGAAEPARLREWRAFASVLRDHLPGLLVELGYPERYHGWVIEADEEAFDPDDDDPLFEDAPPPPPLPERAGPSRVWRILADL